MNEIAVISGSTAVLTADEMRGQIQRIQEVMKAVMRADVHYGTIPGTNKPSLWKAGAEVLCATFRIAPKYEMIVETRDGGIIYQVRCIGVHQTSGAILAEGMGSASTNEEKYRWRKAVCDAEFDAIEPALRRVKYARGKSGSHFTIKQIRTETADYENTVLKIACKRAHIAMTLNATAASDIFTQGNATEPGERGDDDRDGHGEEQEHRRGPQPRTPSQEPAKEPEESPAASSGMVKFALRKLAEHNKTPEAALEHFKLATFDGVTVAQANALIEWAAAGAEAA